MPDTDLILGYDVDQFPFRRWFENVFRTRELEKLHEVFDVTAESYGTNVLEAQNACIPHLDELQCITDRFMNEVVTAEFGDILSYQAIPTLRFNFSIRDIDIEKENRLLDCIGSWEYLRRFYLNGPRFVNFHRDRDYGLVSGSINLWVPVTNARDLNALWVGGSGAAASDALPIALEVGQAFFFDGGNRWHGSVWNTSGITRVSFDIRFMSKGGWLRRNCECLDQIKSRLLLASQRHS